MKHGYIKLLTIGYLSCICSTASADMLGGDTAFLSKMWVQNKEKLVMMGKQLTEAKATADSLRSTVDQLEGIEKEYSFWRNFSLRNEIDSVERGFLNDTVIDDLANAKDPYSRYELSKILVRKRFDRDTSIAVDENAKEGEIPDYLTTSAQSNWYAEESANVLTDPDMTDKDYSRLTAASTALLAADAMDRRAEKLQQKIRKRENLTRTIEFEGWFDSYLGGGQ